MDVPLRPEPSLPDEPYGNDIEAEFGVTIHRSGALSGTVGLWTCQLPGTTLWVQGESLADLRDELIRYKWLNDAGRLGE